MKGKCASGVTAVLLVLSLLDLAYGGDYPVSLEYDRAMKFSGFRKKVGSILGIAPFQDQRPGEDAIGRFAPLRNAISYFKSEPVSLERAIQKAVRKALAQSTIQTILVSGWDGKPKSMRTLKVDSILMMIVKKFWIEGRVVSRNTKMHASIHFIFCLGIKKLEKVFIQNVFIEKNSTFSILGSQDVVQWINRTSADALDSFFRNPY